MSDKEFHLKNALEAREFWKTVPPEGVVHRLLDFHSSTECGATHCFGGWLPYSEYFAGLGVRGCAGPVHLKDGVLNGTLYEGVENYGVSIILFGEMGMFSTRQEWEERVLKGAGLISSRFVSDHEFVAARIQYLINNLEKEIASES
jgi:hypothetical protein